MKVDPEVLNCATGLLQMVREAERSNGWEAGALMRTTLRLLVVAGADGHGWNEDDLTEEVRDLVEAVRTTNADNAAASGAAAQGGRVPLRGRRSYLLPDAPSTDAPSLTLPRQGGRGDCRRFA